MDRIAGNLGRCASDDTPRIARASLHHWEEPPISGSSGSGTIFFTGCSLGCAYCQNHEISRGHVGKPFDSEGIANICLELERKGALNINFVTPTHFSPSIREAIKLAKARGLTLPIVWNTSGYELVSQIEANKGLVDIYLTDFKYFDDGLAGRLSRVSDYRDVAIKALDAMVREVGEPIFDEHDGQCRMTRGVIVRHMMIPGKLSDSKNVISALHDRYGDDISLSLMSQYTPILPSASCIDEDLSRTVTDSEYEELLDHADTLGIDEYYWQDGQACLESFIPDFTSGCLLDD